MSAIERAVQREWETIVATAVVGTDRRPLPAADAGFDVWSAAPDHAAALLDRAAAVVVSRRAGVRPLPVTTFGTPAPDDPRPACPAPCAQRLRRLLRGEHDELVPEWFARCAEAGLQLPGELLPRLLLRGRRDPAFDAMVRNIAGDRAAWLADVLPELGVEAAPRRSPAHGATTLPPEPPDDSAAVATAVVEACRTGIATWATAPELRRAVISLDPEVLPALVAGLSRLTYQPAVERTRSELLGLAEFRHAMVLEFSAAAAGAVIGTVAP